MKRSSTYIPFYLGRLTFEHNMDRRKTFCGRMNIEHTPKAHDGAAVNTARFSVDGSFFLTGGADRDVRLWDTLNGNLLGIFRELEGEVRDVCITCDGSKFSSCGDDGKILYWDLSTHSLIRKFGGYDSVVNSVKFNDFASVVVSAGSKGVRLWDLRSHTTEPVQTLGTSDFVVSLGLRRTEIIVAGAAGTIQNFDLRSSRRLSYNVGAPVKRISMSKESGGVLASCRDHTLQLLHVDTRTIETVAEYKGSTCEMTDCCFTYSAAHVVGGSEDGDVFIWDMLTKAIVSTFRAHSSAVTTVSCHPKDNCLLTASKDGSVAVWKE